MLMGNRLLARNIFQFLYETEKITPLIVANFSDDTKDSDFGVSLLKTVIENNVFYIQSQNINRDRDALKIIQDFSPNLAISCSYEKIIKQNVINLVDGNFLNFHFSRLPKHRGCYPIVWALASGDKEIGVTLHHLSTGIDDGDIIKQTSLPVYSGSTAKEMYEQCVYVATEMFKQFWYEFLDKDTLPKIPQNSGDSSYHTLRYPFDRWIPWHLSCHKVASVINALTFHPNPSGRSIYKGEPIEILGSSLPFNDYEIKNLPGLIKKRDGKIVVECVDGIVTATYVRRYNRLYLAEEILQEGEMLVSCFVEEYNP